MQGFPKWAVPPPGGDFKTYTKYFRVADKEQKKVLGILNWSSVGGGNSNLKIFLGNPGLMRDVVCGFL